MKIYMVESFWYDDVYKEDHFRNLAAFMSKKSAKNYIDTLDASYDDEVDLWISEYELNE